MHDAWRAKMRINGAPSSIVNNSENDGIKQKIMYISLRFYRN